MTSIMERFAAFIVPNMAAVRCLADAQDPIWKVGKFGDARNGRCRVAPLQFHAHSPDKADSRCSWNQVAARLYEMISAPYKTRN